MIAPNQDLTHREIDQWRKRIFLAYKSQLRALYRPGWILRAPFI